MGPARGRRDFLQVLLGGAAALSLPSSAFGQRPSGSLGSTPLRDNLVMFSGAGGNVVVIDGPDGLVLVNGGSEDRSGELLRTVQERAGGRPVRMLFNTDWRREHTGSNGSLGKAGAVIVAHEYTKQYLGAQIYVDWQERTYEPLPKHALPNRTFYTSDHLDFGTERIECGHLGQAHTDAAIYVFVPRANVLIAGGALSVGSYPIADYTTGGWLGGLTAANKTLLGLGDADTQIVPAVGAPQTRADLQRQHDMLEAMLNRFAMLMRQGQGPDDILAAGATKEYDRQWGDPGLFVKTSYRGMWLHVRELGKIV
jgi:glyoxylase-like metal-dependent hydrolase (beta-lactamase superfamily II)